MDTHDLHRMHMEGASLRKLSSLSGSSVHTLSKRFREAGLPVRSRTESVILENKNRPQGHGSRGGKSRSHAVRATQLKRQRLAQEYRNSKGCERCGESHPAVLDLHHRNPEEKHRLLRSYGSVAGRRGRIGGRGWKEVPLRDLEDELSKCDVLCSNCHRKEEWEARRREAS